MPPPPTPVKVRVWFIVSVRIRAGGNFPQEQLSSYNQFHNILSLFDVLQSFPVTTSGTMVDYYL